jgi:hypothetical protein
MEHRCYHQEEKETYGMTQNKIVQENEQEKLKQEDYG